MYTRVVIGLGALLAAATPCAAQDVKPEVKVKLEGHRGGVTALALSPGGDVVATGSGNGVVRLWDPGTGEVLAKVDEAGGTRIVHVGFSADGKILSAAARKVVSAWRVTDPKKPTGLFSDTYQESEVKIGGISGDGRRLYHFDGHRSILRYYDVRSTSAEQTDVRDPKFHPLAFGTIPDPESALAAVLCRENDNKGAVLVFVGLGDRWQLTEGLKGPDANPNAVSFSPDARWLVVCCGGEVMVWKVPGSQKVSGRPRALAPIIGSTYTAAAAGPGNVLAVAEKSNGEGKKARVQLLDLAAAEPKVLATFATDIDDVSVLAFAPDGRALAVADTVEGIVQLWALSAKK
jgi:WD40 repeat protein